MRLRTRLMGLVGICLISATGLADEGTSAANAGSPVVANSLAGLNPVVSAPGFVGQPSVVDRYGSGDGLPEWVGNPAASITGPPSGCYYTARGRNWLQVDYLLWWMQGQRLQPLAATTAGDVVLGDRRLNTTNHNGVRIRGGRYLDCDANCGLMVDFFGFNSSGDRQSVTGPGLVLPFTDMDLSLPANQNNGCGCLDDLVGTAATVPLDALSVVSDTRVFSGGIYGRSRLNSWYDCCQQDCCCNGGCFRCGHRLDAIFGYRYFGLDEALVLNTRLAPRDRWHKRA